jgi:regulator of sirC expression with transglutaminase-like and TPR domain
MRNQHDHRPDLGVAVVFHPQKKMKRILLTLLLAIALGGCKSPAPGPLAKKLLAVSSQAGFPLTDRDALGKILDLAEKKTKGESGADKIDALNRLIFEELKFEREVQDDSIKFMLLPYVLEHKKGSCLGLAALYLALAERSGLEVRGVLVPRHFFLRHKHRNIELLRKGAAMPDEWYKETWQVPAGAPAYLRMLTERELLAVFWFNLGNARRMKGEYEKAEEIYGRVIADFPDFAEAHANLGLVLQLQKKFEPAMESYLDARALQPGLPGLKQNIDALKTDMGLPVDDSGMLDGQ